MTRLLQISTLVVLATLAGCQYKPADPPPIDTGARGVVQVFFDALGRRDWAQVYAAIDGNRWSQDEFARRAEQYHRKLGFETFTVHIQSCEERGEEATAHVVLNGKGHGRHYFKDTVMLTRAGGTWRIVLPATFGK